MTWSLFADNVNIQIDGVLYLRVVEPYKVPVCCEILSCCTCLQTSVALYIDLYYCLATNTIITRKYRLQHDYSFFVVVSTGCLKKLSMDFTVLCCSTTRLCCVQDVCLSVCLFVCYADILCQHWLRKLYHQNSFTACISHCGHINFWERLIMEVGPVS